MCSLETISTADVAAHRKVRFWNEAVSAAVATAAADPLDAGTFSGTMRCLDLRGRSGLPRSPAVLRA